MMKQSSVISVQVEYVTELTLDHQTQVIQWMFVHVYASIGLM